MDQPNSQPAVCHTTHHKVATESLTEPVSSVGNTSVPDPNSRPTAVKLKAKKRAAAHTHKLVVLSEETLPSMHEETIPSTEPVSDTSVLGPNSQPTAVKLKTKKKATAPTHEPVVLSEVTLPSMHEETIPSTNTLPQDKAKGKRKPVAKVISPILEESPSETDSIIDQEAGNIMEGMYMCNRGIQSHETEANLDQN